MNLETSAYLFTAPPLTYVPRKFVYIYLFINLFTFVCVLTVNMYVHLVNAWCPRRAKEGIRFPGAEAISSYQSPYR